VASNVPNNEFFVFFFRNIFRLPEKRQYSASLLRGLRVASLIIIGGCDYRLSGGWGGGWDLRLVIFAFAVQIYFFIILCTV